MGIRRTVIDRSGCAVLDCTCCDWRESSQRKKAAGNQLGGKEKERGDKRRKAEEEGRRVRCATFTFMR